jgi:hypothetical protein
MASWVATRRAGVQIDKRRHHMHSAAKPIDMDEWRVDKPGADGNLALHRFRQQDNN